ncbi:MAG: hypothetical protein MUC58_09230 [Rhizobiaceae bacterium]|jgi:TPR repeat protein|nr:hypothetical protein [Rhizobiaceae bacterium]
MSNEELEQIVMRANSGDVEAQIHLGWVYDRFGSLPYDPAAAEMWLRRAATGGNLEGLRRLCRFLYDHDRAETLQHARTLVDLDDFYGHYLMGHILRNGRFGVNADLNSAFTQFKKAIEKGHIPSEIDAIKMSSYAWYLWPIKFFRLVAASVKFFILHLRNKGAGLETYR